MISDNVSNWVYVIHDMTGTDSGTSAELAEQVGINDTVWQMDQSNPSVGRKPTDMLSADSADNLLWVMK